ncbi:hypothetical protein MBAV_005572 [Candidatus Magnetobacterium bavaricum]|uniref:Uncharacterized protein n=1 Tax=Candidatus Magnetobacterium bavaricum TaxID=29290 RepID=A0A0F3GJU5_9BACT|nr:hypothetical protein MBAV_005572 [Candidatus Magnetobacterium bavaricum]
MTKFLKHGTINTQVGKGKSCQGDDPVLYRRATTIIGEVFPIDPIFLLPAYHPVVAVCRIRRAFKEVKGGKCGIQFNKVGVVVLLPTSLGCYRNSALCLRPQQVHGVVDVQLLHLMVILKCRLRIDHEVLRPGHQLIILLDKAKGEIRQKHRTTDLQHTLFRVVLIKDIVYDPRNGRQAGSPRPAKDRAEDKDPDIVAAAYVLRHPSAKGLPRLVIRQGYVRYDGSTYCGMASEAVFERGLSFCPGVQDVKQVCRLRSFVGHIGVLKVAAEVGVVIQERPDLWLRHREL